MAHMPLFINRHLLFISTVYDHHVQTQAQQLSLKAESHSSFFRLKDGAFVYPVTQVRGRRKFLSV